MKTYRTAAQWLGLLQQRSNFKGTNVEFCQHHNVSITTYYKQRTLQAENQQKTTLPTRATSSRFIQPRQDYHKNKLGKDILKAIKLKKPKVTKLVIEADEVNGKIIGGAIQRLPEEE